MAYRTKGVPPGYRERWKYTGLWDETKKKPGLWNFTFQATKRRRAKGYGPFGKGTKGAWKIKGIQYIEKTGKGQYQTKLIGTKKPLKFYVKKHKKWINANVGQNGESTGTLVKRVNQSKHI